MLDIFVDKVPWPHEVCFNSLLEMRCHMNTTPRSPLLRRVSILYWRCEKEKGGEKGVGLPVGFNSLLEMQLYELEAGVWRVVGSVSILYWRCARTVKLVMMEAGDVSILYWRCAGATSGAAESRRNSFNSLLEMPPAGPGPLRGHVVLSLFQFSIGDARVDSPRACTTP